MAEKKDTQKYSVSILRKHSLELFGVEQHVIDGVFAEHREDSFTKEDAKVRIDKWFKNKQK